MTSRAELHDLLNHSWSIPIKRAAIIQSKLAQHVRLTPMRERPRFVGGIDYAQEGDHVFLSLVLMDIKEWKVIEIQSAEGITSFPDKPGYLAFRLGPLILQSHRNLYHKPDLYFINGAGVCHPRLCGIASHIGLRTGTTTIGCTLERQAGHFEPPGVKRGSYSVVRYSPQAPGVVLRTRLGVNPVFVSPGHCIDLLGTIDVTMRCSKRYRMPEPLRRAHIEAGRFMRQRLEKNGAVEKPK